MVHAQLCPDQPTWPSHSPGSGRVSSCGSGFHTCIEVDHKHNEMLAERWEPAASLQLLVPAAYRVPAAAAACLLLLLAAPGHPFRHGCQLDIEQRLVVHQGRLGQLTTLERVAVEEGTQSTSRAGQQAPWLGTSTRRRERGAQHKYTGPPSPVPLGNQPAELRSGASDRNLCKCSPARAPLPL